jgi:hypothetical protein
MKIHIGIDLGKRWRKWFVFVEDCGRKMVLQSNIITYRKAEKVKVKFLTIMEG